MEDYPPEVRSAPLLLCGLVGATQIHGQLMKVLHESAVETCGQKRVKYLSFSYDMRIPPCKRGGKDTPGYRIAGILKHRWLEKVCNLVPAVLVVCFDWTEELQPSPPEEAQAVSQLQHAQRQARDRELRILVLCLVHESAAEPEAMCAGLRQKLEGTTGALVVVRGTQDLAARAQKLERSVYQSAMSFYAEEEKRQRTVWNPKPANVPQWALTAMQVRISLKMGFLSEFRKDARGALNHYVKAYDHLRNCDDIADVVERMALCNHFTCRIYQRYFQSHEIGLAVRHCRIHTATLRGCSDDDGALAWRKWRWLSQNHQIFGELLESSVQTMPVLVNEADMWQFPGFHYKLAATYARRLKRWACDAAGGKLPPAALVGGELVPAVFLGQPERLERQEECKDPSLEVALRSAHSQAAEIMSSQQCLHLLHRAQECYKERNYSAGLLACSSLIAEEYLEAGNMLGATKLYERLRRSKAEGESGQQGLWPEWVGLRRFALERAILCGCRVLGLEALPSICERSLAVPPRPAAGGEAGKAAGGAAGEEPTAGPAESGAPPADVQRQLVLDSFEYLALTAAAAGAQETSGPEAWQADLLAAVRAALASSPPSAAPEAGPPAAVEAALEGLAFGEVAFEDAGAAGPQASATFTVQLHSRLAVPLELGEVVAVTSCGDVRLAPSDPPAEADATLTWRPGSPLALRGEWPLQQQQGGAAAGEDRVEAVRLSWAAAPWVSLLVRALRAAGRAEPLLPPPRPPSLGAAAASALAQGGVERPRRAVLPLRAEAFLPVDPSSALVSEAFVLHVIISSDKVSESPLLKEGCQVWMSCAIQAHEDTEAHAQARGDDARAFLLGAGDRAPAEAWALKPLSHEQAVADVAADGELRPAGRVVALPAERLAGAPQAAPPPRKAAAGDAPPSPSSRLAVPVVVRAGRECRAVLSIRLELRSTAGAGGTVPGAVLGPAVVAPSVSLHFRHALQVSFDEGGGGGAAAAAAAAGGRSSSMPRRFTLKALAPVAVELQSLEVVEVLRTAGAGSEPATPASGAAAAEAEQPTRPPCPVLGQLGRVAPGSLHVFALPPGRPLEAASMVRVRFARDNAVSAFFPPAVVSRDGGAFVAGQPPGASQEWQITKEAQPGTPVSSTLMVDLDHAPTSAVGEPLQVRIRVRGAVSRAIEAKVRVSPKESGETSEKFFISGPTTTHTILAAREDPKKPQACMSFTLVPLRPGSLTLPRVAVSADTWEVNGVQSSVFVFPAAQPVHHRSVI